MIRLGVGVMLGLFVVAAGVAAALAYQYTTNSLQQERIDEAVAIRTKKDFIILTELLEAYRQLNGRFPTTKQGLRALAVRPTSEPQPLRWQALIREEGLLDPWGRPYQYAAPGRHNTATYDVWSQGRDVADPADDIGNW